jgi:hypothetical protein
VRDVFAVDDQQVTGGVLAVDDSGPLKRTDGEIGGDVAFDVGDADHGAAGVDGQVADAVAVFVDLALVAEAVGEGRVVQGGALEVFDEDVLMSPGSAWAGIAGARSRVMRKLRSMTCRLVGA